MPKQSLKSALKSKPKPRRPPGPQRSRRSYADPTPRSQPSIGAQIGDGLQKWGTSVFNRIIGNGDYALPDDISNIKRNDLFVDAVHQPPSFSGNDHSFLFEHSEYITDIVSSSVVGGFTTQTFTVNPTNSLTFPWLNNIAENFENYEIEGMIFRFVSTSGTAVSSTNSQLGSIMATYVYDSMDPHFINKQQMLQYEGVVSARSSENFLVGVECARDTTALRTLYCGQPPAGSDPKFYNHGKLHVASQGMQAANQTIGELYCHYKIRMKITKDSLDDLASSHLRALSLITDALPYGTTHAITGQLAVTTSGNTATITNATIGQRYLVVYSGDYSNLTGFIASLTYTGADVYDGLEQGTADQRVSFDAGNSNITGLFTATSNTVAITTNISSTATTRLQSDLYVTPVDLNIV